MKKKLLILLILISSYTFAADVNGNVFLDNTANFENCTITFSPLSPSAVLNEIVSKSDGSFIVNIPNGVYNIKYQKNGYQTYELLDIFINGTMTLDNITLSSNNLILVSGNVNGLWTKGNTYKVTGNITVPNGQTLTIEEGVEVKFDGYYSLIVNGTLLANGSANNYIKFTSNSNSPTNKDWNQILVNSTESSKMNYCIIEYGKMHNDNGETLLDIRGNMELTNSLIRHSDETGLGIKSSGVVNIKNNKIFNCLHGIAANGSGVITIHHNEVHDNTYYGISVGMSSSSTLVKENIIYNCNYVGLGITSGIKVERNIIFNNPYGIFVAYCKPNIVNNTIVFNQNGIGLYDNEKFMITNPIINSNIIANNLHYGIHSQGVNKPDSVTYNLFYNNNYGTGNILPIGVGPIITVNKNNTPSDANYNIFVNPEFESIVQTEDTFYNLRSYSPAVNAGAPSISMTNGTIADIGAKELGGNLSTGEFTNTKGTNVKVFPNPTTDFLSFETNQNYTFDSIKFFDINGKIIDQVKLDESKSTYQWKITSHFNRGIYLYIIMNGSSIIDSGKFIKK
ncbi:right-handed parallel beta-helix repeat-containing protein [Flavobacterium sp. PL02]|uniref:right-handed parallel beta-helix repeat-containing protein n=1 Tax=Flavobacterium sp. PL02 TaxID=3088354 RepID=UPI002B23BB18|nr:right-handed parallel beta-helix repeat-containing protein [Flavobacterium sp. PL02]MEA9415017.1 right-handed parallel beta-helix repeat-containing protein [Flavobacterium sp. PL02]